jgi:hypothetical protein
MSQRGRQPNANWPSIKMIFFGEGGTCSLVNRIGQWIMHPSIGSLNMVSLITSQLPSSHWHPQEVKAGCKPKRRCRDTLQTYHVNRPKHHVPAPPSPNVALPLEAKLCTRGLRGSVFPFQEFPLIIPQPTFAATMTWPLTSVDRLSLMVIWQLLTS